jgi:hypothetical protein
MPAVCYNPSHHELLSRLLDLARGLVSVPASNGKSTAASSGRPPADGRARPRPGVAAAEPITTTPQPLLAAGRRLPVPVLQFPRRVLAQLPRMPSMLPSSLRPFRLVKSLLQVGRPLQADRSIAGGQLPALGQPHPAPARCRVVAGLRDLAAASWPLSPSGRCTRACSSDRRGEGSCSEDLFFSFTTLTTTGHGNLVRAATRARAWPSGRCLSGSCLVTAVAKVVSTWRPSPGRGHLPTDNDRD